MTFKIPALLILSLLTSGCATTNAPEETPIVPADFIVEQDASSVRAELNLIYDTDHVVKFNIGGSTVPNNSLDDIVSWLSGSSATMVAVRGTAGTDKYKELGEKRTLSTVEALMSIGGALKIVLLDYDPSLAGGRAIISVVPDELATRVQSEAPIMIVSSN